MIHVLPYAAVVAGVAVAVILVIAGGLAVVLTIACCSRGKYQRGM